MVNKKTIDIEEVATVKYKRWAKEFELNKDKMTKIIIKRTQAIFFSKGDEIALPLKNLKIIFKSGEICKC